jgi:penicillin amidase
VAAGSRFTLEDSERMQNDIVASPAQRLLKLLAGLRGDDAETAAGLRLLRAWDGNGPHSAAAALYEVWSANACGRGAQSRRRRSGCAAGAPGDAARVRCCSRTPAAG